MYMVEKRRDRRNKEVENVGEKGKVGERKEGGEGGGETEKEGGRGDMFMVGFVLKHFSGRGTIILMVQKSEINRFQVLMDII